ncbi:hypothetical protein B0H21DRAFT_699472 [Amylocystis lapponica]|nr:hypothetical protein B0H21DRAFT_699472 [Amylocystis lapponica]
MRRGIQNQRATIEQHVKRIALLEEECHKKSAQISKLDALRDKRDARLADAEHRANALQNEHQSTRALLKTRTDELRAAQVYLSRADAVSDADVCRILRDLNAEIFQTAASIADIYGPSDDDPLALRADTEAAAKIVADALGQTMLGILQHATDALDPMVVQIALQACLARFVMHKATEWEWGSSTSQRAMRKVYRRMLVQETQAVTDRWRALTRRHLRPHASAEPEIMQTLARTLLSSMMGVLVLVGMEKRAAEALLCKFQANICSIVESTDLLRKTIGEDIVACEMEPFVVRGSDLFDAACMEDVEGGPVQSGPRPVQVVCSTEVGLRRSERVGDGPEGEWQTAVLVKSKVVLERLMEALLEDDDRDQSRRSTPV